MTVTVPTALLVLLLLLAFFSHKVEPFVTQSTFNRLTVRFDGATSEWDNNNNNSNSKNSNNNNNSNTSNNNNNNSNKEKRLTDVVCVVTGASRGIGKGIALALGKEGATVYITGTSSSSSTTKTTKYSTNEQVGGPGTIDETARAVTEAGGIGIAVQCNHADDEQVKALFQQVETSHGRLDILVNNVFRVPPGGTDGLFGKFYDLPIDTWDTLHDVGVRSHYVASVYAMPLLLTSRATTKLPRPFIAMISSFGGLTYTFNVPYGVGKAAVDRLAKDMAIELETDNIAVTSFWPGVVRTERTELMVQSGEWDKKVGIPLDHAESPEFTGRAIIAVAIDETNKIKSGTTQVVAELANEYKFTDTNGKNPPSIRSLRFLLPTYGMNKEMRSKVPLHLIPDWKLPFWVMAQGKPPEKKIG